MPQQQPSVDASFAKIYDGVFAPAFFAKLASYGIVPASREDARNLLDIGHNVLAAQQQQKAAAAGDISSFIAKAAADLSAELGVAAPVEDDRQIAKLAAEYSKDNEIAAAATNLFAQATRAAGG